MLYRCYPNLSIIEWHKNIFLLTDQFRPVRVGDNQINTYKCLNQLVMYLGVRKPVGDANRSGCSYEIPDMTWFFQAE